MVHRGSTLRCLGAGAFQKYIIGYFTARTHLPPPTHFITNHSAHHHPSPSTTIQHSWASHPLHRHTLQPTKDATTQQRIEPPHLASTSSYI
ncbi:hypothetical protein E2C01_025943 [Portunus trituberculatus]|uniref:Uncharacterized protein n=1 Tax=Portunus trituberculatus TaxID=210409 RepID=A0A5B7EES6_PORTR|nr:hypothetical protein [Portunus trituberculatus]